MDAITDYEKYDKILYIKSHTFYFERVESSRISRVNEKQRKRIIDGMLNEEVKEVKKIDHYIYYYYHSGKKWRYRE
jgi:hypothetical protein